MNKASINPMNKSMHKTINQVLIVSLLAAGLWSASAQALNLGDALKEAAKKQIDKELGQDKPAEAAPAPAASPAQPAAAPASANPTPTANQTTANGTATANASTTPVAAPSAAAAEPEKPTINWKKPSREEEIALGREITGSILGAAPLVKDDALQKYVNQVGRWLANQSERDSLPWKFGVIDSADINAFAAPGGYVLITKGLYQKLQNESQLAAVLGHEIAHVVQKHQLKVMQKQQLVNAGSDWIKQKFGKKNKITQKAISTGAEISARGLDKDAEFEADRMGMILAARAGYDVYSLSEVLEMMSRIKSGDNSVSLLFKTHPAPDERLAKLGEAAGDKLDNMKAGKTLENRLVKTQ